MRFVDTVKRAAFPEAKQSRHTEDGFDSVRFELPSYKIEVWEGSYTDEELQRLSVARRYQLAQQCLAVYNAQPEEARALVQRLGKEYLAWLDYMLQRKQNL